MPELEATAPAIPFWFYRVVAGAAELGGWLRQQGARNNTARVSAVCALQDFELAGWCSLSLGGAAPSAAPDHARAGGHGAADFLFGFIGWWPARPSHGVSFADGGLATTR
jgi:hypothetical protein